MKSTVKRIALLLACIMLAGIFNGCTGGKSDTIRIGVFQPQTGAYAAGGALEIEGIELAHALKGAVLGKTIELVKVDNKSDKDSSAQIIKTLVETGKVDAIIGSWDSGSSLAASDTIRSLSVPTIGASCTNDDITKGNDWYFRICYTNKYQGYVLADYMHDELRVHTVAVLVDTTSSYSTELANVFTEEFSFLAGDSRTSVVSIEYKAGDTDFASQLAAIESSGAEAILLTGEYQESAMFVKQVYKAGVNLPIVGGDACETSEFIDIGGSAVEGVAYTTYFDEHNEATSVTTDFAEAYRAKYNKEPTSAAAAAFDAYNVIVDAIESNGNTDPEGLRQAIANTSGKDGAAGVITFDENGDNKVQDAMIKSVMDGKFIFLTAISDDQY